MRLEALLAALRELFGPRLGFGPAEGEMLPMLGDGIEENRVWLGVTRTIWCGASRRLPTPPCWRVWDGAASIQTPGRRLPRKWCGTARACG